MTANVFECNNFIQFDSNILKVFSVHIAISMMPKFYVRCQMKFYPRHLFELPFFSSFLSSLDIFVSLKKKCSFTRDCVKLFSEFARENSPAIYNKFSNQAKFNFESFFVIALWVINQPDYYFNIKVSWHSCMLLH